MGSKGDGVERWASAACFRRRRGCKASGAAVATDGICRGQTVVDSMDFWKKEPNSHVLTETDTERFMRFFFSRVLKKQDGSKWEAEELTLLSCL